MLVLAALPSFIIGLEGIGDPTSLSTDIGVLELLATIAAAAGPAAMAVHLLWRDRRLDTAGFARRDARFVVGWGLFGLLLCYAALIAAVVVVDVVYVAAGGDLESLGEREDNVDLTAASLAVAYAIALTAGVTEEIVFRAYAITRLEELGWGRSAFIVPGVVFTTLHLYQGVLALVLIGAITVAFTWLFRLKRSVWPVMVAHALFDGVQLTLLALLS